MIHQVEGDILLSRAAAIAHGVAPNDPMDQGLALALRERYPALHKDFHHWCHQQQRKPGEAWAWGGTDGVRIVTLLTQPAGPGHRPGRAHIEDVNHALRALRKVVEKERFGSLAIPRLATGVGALAWKDVAPLVENHLGGLDAPVFVYVTYRPQQQAREPGA